MEASARLDAALMCALARVAFRDIDWKMEMHHSLYMCNINSVCGYMTAGILVDGSDGGQKPPAFDPHRHHLPHIVTFANNLTEWKMKMHQPVQCPVIRNISRVTFFQSAGVHNKQEHQP